jgi:hypothetical protein
LATGEGDGPGNENETPFLKWKGVFYFPAFVIKIEGAPSIFCPNSYFLLKIKQIKTFG